MLSLNLQPGVPARVLHPGSVPYPALPAGLPDTKAVLLMRLLGPPASDDAADWELCGWIAFSGTELVKVLVARPVEDVERVARRIGF